MSNTIFPADTSGVHPVIAQNEPHSANMPIAISRRGSLRPASRPATIIAAMVPTPRGAITSPAVATG